MCLSIYPYIGYGFVDFQRPEDAQRGLAALLANGVVAEFANVSNLLSCLFHMSSHEIMYTVDTKEYGGVVLSLVC